MINAWYTDDIQVVEGQFMPMYQFVPTLNYLKDLHFLMEYMFTMS